MKSIKRILFILCLAPILAYAQAWPSKPVRLIVPFPPGGPTDIIARILSQGLGEAWGQAIPVENRPGAGGNIGAAQVAKSAPDGYTVLVHTSAIAANTALSANPGYDIEKDFISITNVATSPNMILTGMQGAATLRELIEKAKSAGLVYGSPGQGTAPHLAAEYVFRAMAGLKVTHVPYKGGSPAATAAMAGEVPAVSMAMPTAVPLVKGNKLRGLAVMSSARTVALPEVPTLAEAGYPGFEDSVWVGVFLPAGTPAPIVQKLHAEIEKMIARPELRERLQGIGFEAVGGTPDAFTRYVRGEVAKWVKVVKEIGLKAE